MVQCAKSVAMNIDDQGAIDTWRRQNGSVSIERESLKSASRNIHILDGEFDIILISDHSCAEHKSEM